MFDDLLDAGDGDVKLARNLAEGIACIEASKDCCVALYLWAM